VAHDEHKCASCDAARRADGEELSTCAGCHVVHYCSPPCQRADWPRHKHECKDMLAQTSVNKAYIFKEGAAATQARREREPAASLGELLREAERGDAHAQYRYADACGGAEQLRWLNKSAAQGHRGAVERVGARAEPVVVHVHARRVVTVVLEDLRARGRGAVDADGEGAVLPAAALALGLARRPRRL
jgi:hypothetical protein